MKICILGAAFNTENMGIGALTCGIVQSILNNLPESEIILMEYSREPAEYPFRHGNGIRIVKLVNMRFSKNVLLGNHIGKVFVASVLRKLLKRLDPRRRAISPATAPCGRWPRPTSSCRSPGGTVSATSTGPSVSLRVPAADRGPPPREETCPAPPDPRAFQGKGDESRGEIHPQPFPSGLFPRSRRDGRDEGVSRKRRGSRKVEVLLRCRIPDGAGKTRNHRASGTCRGTGERPSARGGERRADCCSWAGTRRTTCSGCAQTTGSSSAT